MPGHYGNQAHGYVRLRLLPTAPTQPQGNAAIAAIQALGALIPVTDPTGVALGNVQVENIAWMEDPGAAAVPANGQRPFGRDIFVEVTVPGYTNPINQRAHEMVVALQTKFLGLKAGAVSHFDQGLKNHWCCYSDW